VIESDIGEGTFGSFGVKTGKGTHTLVARDAAADV